MNNWDLYKFHEMAAESTRADRANEMFEKTADRSIVTAESSNVTAIGSYAFSHCYSLRTANFPNVTSIGDYAFNYCYHLQTAKFSRNITSVGSYAFSNCGGLKDFDIDLPNLTSVSSNAFYGVPVRTFNLPNATYASANSMPYAADNATLYYAPKVSYTFSMSSFRDAPNLTLDISSATVSAISDSQFSRKSGGGDWKVGRISGNIGEYGFYGCVNLRSFDFDISGSIGAAAFYGCYNLEKIVIRKTSVASIASNSFAGSKIVNGLGYIYVPDNLVESYQSTYSSTVFASQFKGISELS